MEKAVKKFLEFVNKSPSDSKELFSDVETKKVSVQVVLHKIPNLINEKQVLWYIYHIKRMFTKPVIN